MNIPYRTRQALKRLVVVLLILAVLAVAVWLCWLLWLGRYVVYTRDGAVIDMDRSSQDITGELAVPPDEEGGIEVYYNEGQEAAEKSTELGQIIGYYITTSDLEGDLTELRQELRNLPAGSAVMVEVKNSFGSLFYNSAASEFRPEGVDVQAVDKLLRDMNEMDLYTIARLPALRDYSFGLNYTYNGLAHPGGYLWADEDYRYWLNPAKEGTVSYLASIGLELREMGFDEVVYFDFHFPDTENIVFSGDKTEALAIAAQTLVTTCSNSFFAVSFEGSELFTQPEGRTRVYLRDVDALALEEAVLNSGVENTKVQLVFVTSTYDTRFEEYGVLRPIEGAH